MATEYPCIRKLAPWIKIVRFRYKVTSYTRIRVPTHRALPEMVTPNNMISVLEYFYRGTGVVGGYWGGGVKVSAGAGFVEVEKVAQPLKAKKIPPVIKERSGERRLYSVGVNISSSGDNNIIGAYANKSIYIANILLIARGEVVVTLKSGALNLSGGISLGATNQPRGFFSHLGDYPLVCQLNQVFVINLSAAIEVDGFITFYYE